jgi:hypothetical protein
MKSSKTRSQPATAASAAALAGAESIASPASKRRKLGAAAAHASGPSSAKPPAQGAAADGASKRSKAKGKPAALRAAAAAGAGKGSKAKPSAAAAAAAAGANAASTPKNPKSRQAANPTDQSAASKSAQAAGGSKQHKEPPAAASGADTSTAADQQPKQKKQRAPKPREIPELPTYHPAKVCEEEWRAQQDAYLADMAAIRRQALGARPPVLLENGNPAFLAEPEDLLVRMGNQGYGVLTHRSHACAAVLSSCSRDVLGCGVFFHECNLWKRHVRDAGLRACALTCVCN